MFEVEIYSRIRDELDISYQIKDKTFEKENNIPDNLRTRNFIEIIRILSEKGYCSANEIAEEDNYSNGKIRKKNRRDDYRRIITGGNDGRISGLINKGIVKSENKEWRKTKNTKFRLTLFGVLYSIRLFSERPVTFGQVKNLVKINKNNQKITMIDILSKNYSEELPLVFKKFSFFKKELPGLDILLHFIAHHVPHSTDLLHYPFFDTKPFGFEEFKNESDTIENEFTILFLGYLYLALEDTPKKFQKILSKDQEIYTYYEKYLSILDKVQRFRRYKVKAVYYDLTDQPSKKRQVLKKAHSLEGKFPSNVVIEHLMKQVTKS